jgi:hypothetical protein
MSTWIERAAIVYLAGGVVIVALKAVVLIASG